MKILQINKFNYLKGGADKYFLDLSNLLQKNGHQIVKFTMDDLKAIDFSRPKFVPLKALRFIYSFEAKRELEKLIKKEKPQIAHLHNIHHYLTPSILSILKKHKIKTVQTIHDWQIICPNYRLLNGRGQLCEKCKNKKYWHCVFNKCVKNSYAASILSGLEMSYWNILRNYDSYIHTYIAPSQFVKTKLVEWGIAKEKIKVVSHFIEPQDTKKETQDYFIYIGRLVKEKGVMTLLESFKMLRDQNLYIIGEGELKAEVKEYIAKNYLTNVKLLGHKKGAELKNLVANAQASIIPSSWYEIFGYTVVEAQTLATPVVASNIGAIPELIKHQKTGLLFKQGNKNDLVKQIQWLLKNIDLAKNMAETAKTNIIENYSSEKHYLTILDIYSFVS